MRRQTPKVSHRAEASRCFQPIADVHARILILGSLPGRVSLSQAQYYAQPQNTFWRIMGALFGAGPHLGYQTRLRILQQRHLAVWDVCASARRFGSLDAAIDRKSLVVNDFAGFFVAHPRIEAVAFNGAMAATVYVRSVLPTLAGPPSGLPLLRLPSTSPAHASMNYADKLTAWSMLRSRLAAPAPT